MDTIGYRPKDSSITLNKQTLKFVLLCSRYYICAHTLQILHLVMLYFYITKQFDTTLLSQKSNTNTIRCFIMPLVCAVLDLYMIL